VTLAGFDLVKTYPAHSGDGQTTAVDDVSFTLAPGETLGLVGESGSGKSTVARMALGLISPTAGRVEFEGKPLAGFSRSDWLRFRRQVQVVFQDPRSALNWRLGIASQITEPLRNFGVGDRAARRVRAAELLDQVNLSSRVLERRPAELSGGQLQRVAIARALALGPTYLVCDEPLSALDVSVQAGIVNLLLDLQTSTGLAMLFISHDLEIVRHMSDQVMVMRHGEVVEAASAQKLYEHADHPYSRELLGLPAQAPDTGADNTPPPAVSGKER
jgi:peptide/nickel transport system ATP-binding protein